MRNFVVYNWDEGFTAEEMSSPLRQIISKNGFYDCLQQLYERYQKMFSYQSWILVRKYSTEQIILLITKNILRNGWSYLK